MYQNQKQEEKKTNNDQKSQINKKEDEDSNKQSEQQKSVKEKSESDNDYHREAITLTKSMDPILYESIFAYTTKIKIDYCSYNIVKADSLILFAYRNHKVQAYPFQQIYKRTMDGNLKTYVNNIQSSDDKIIGIASQMQNFENIMIVLPQFYFNNNKVNQQQKRKQQQKEKQQKSISEQESQKNDKKQNNQQNKNKQQKEQFRFDFTYQIVLNILGEVIDMVNHYKQKKIVMSYLSQHVSDELSDFMIKALVNIFQAKHFLQVNKANKKKFQLEVVRILCGNKQTFVSMRKALQKNCFEFGNL